MGWQAKTFEDHLKEIPLGGDGNLPSNEELLEHQPDGLVYLRRADGRLDARCPICNIACGEGRLIDVSNLPDEITGGHKWACDGCQTRWTRTQIVFKDKNVGERRLSQSVFMELLGAPAELVEKQALKDPQTPTKLTIIKTINGSPS